MHAMIKARLRGAAQWLRSRVTSRQNQAKSSLSTQNLLEEYGQLLKTTIKVMKRMGFYQDLLLATFGPCPASSDVYGHGNALCEEARILQKYDKLLAAREARMNEIEIEILR